MCFHARDLRLHKTARVLHTYAVQGVKLRRVRVLTYYVSSVFTCQDGGWRAGVGRSVLGRTARSIDWYDSEGNPAMTLRSQ